MVVKYLCFGMWCCVVGWAFSGSFKDCSAFIFRVKQSQEVYSSWTAWSWRRKYYDPSKCWKLVNQEHSWIFINSTMGTSNLAQDCGVVISHATRFKAKILREEGVCYLDVVWCIGLCISFKLCSWLLTEQSSWSLFLTFSVIYVSHCSAYSQIVGQLNVPKG